MTTRLNPTDRRRDPAPVPSGPQPIDAIYPLYPGEWVAVKVTALDDRGRISHGEVLAHGASRKKVSRALLRAHRKDPTVHTYLFAGGVAPALSPTLDWEAIEEYLDARWSLIDPGPPASVRTVGDDPGHTERSATLAMVIDSGSPISVISPETAAELRDLHLLKSIRSLYYQYQLTNLTADGQPLPDLGMRALRRLSRIQVAGLVGLDFLRQFAAVHFYVRDFRLVLDVS